MGALIISYLKWSKISLNILRISIYLFNENETVLNREEVIKILRRRNEPIRCFGETDYDTYQRMKLIQLLEPKHGGLDNDFKVAMEKMDEEEAVELCPIVHFTSFLRL